MSITKTQALTAIMSVTGRGAKVDIIDTDGVNKMTVVLKEGLQSFDEIRKLMSSTDVLVTVGPVTVMGRDNNRAIRIKYTRKTADGDSLATAVGANPDYKPTSADRAQRLMAHTVDKLLKKSNKQERMLTRLTRERVEVIDAAAEAQAKLDAKAAAVAAAEASAEAAAGE
ncbi:MAG: hypothetical protein JKY31_08340 [Rhodobacteraceae bacterium]|nr:hypothetical protein [Paracoccaceae bacterium]